MKYDFFPNGNIAHVICQLHLVITSLIIIFLDIIKYYLCSQCLLI